jgi:hypothetical protein
MARMRSLLTAFSRAKQQSAVLVSWRDDFSSQIPLSRRQFGHKSCREESYTAK